MNCWLDRLRQPALVGNLFNRAGRALDRSDLKDLELNQIDPSGLAFRHANAAIIRATEV